MPNTRHHEQLKDWVNAVHDWEMTIHYDNVLKDDIVAMPIVSSIVLHERLLLQSFSYPSCKNTSHNDFRSKPERFRIKILSYSNLYKKSHNLHTPTSWGWYFTCSALIRSQAAGDNSKEVYLIVMQTTNDTEGGDIIAFAVWELSDDGSVSKTPMQWPKVSSATMPSIID